MISNVQQQCFDGVVNNMLKHETSKVCINNNNTNKNKNIGVMPPPAVVLHNRDPSNGFDLISPFTIHSSENAKEYTTPASQNNNKNSSNQGGGFTSLLDEISELIENHPTGTERDDSAFKQNSDSGVIKKKDHISQAILSVNKKQPSSRDEHHRNAFRLIEDVHNYSKLNRSDESTNSSSPDDEDFEEEDEEDDSIDVRKKKDILQRPPKIIRNDYDSVRDNNLISPEKNSNFTRVPEEDEEKTTPEHHARRPMNAFLIFCKRHRAIVREKYKHLENRSITKILGEWWASLDADEKISYTNLAKQYKDAFFNANPNFKWYKLPAPPLRTLSTRPSNIDRPASISSNNSYTITNSYELNNPSRDRTSRSAAAAQYENESDEDTRDASEVGVFKLADEAQMGGLSSLMTNSDISPTVASTQRGDYGINTHYRVAANSVAESLNPLNKDEPFENMKEHAAKVGYHQDLNGKRKHIDDTNLNECKRQMLFIENNISSGEEDILGKKSERSCKGKKYQELMNSGQIITFTKKSKSKGDTHSSTLSLNGYLPHRDNCTTLPTATKTKLEHNNTIADTQKTNNSNNSVNLESPVKQFDASDFDLEEKIKALPAQSLEDYLARKRETKKKKKINSKRYKARRNSNKDTSPKTIQEAKEQIQSQMVGSQKRKARKESITRRDINSITVPNDGQSHVFDSVELWNSTVVKTEPDDNPAVVKTEPIDNDICTNPTESTSDLLILAEVATNHIEDKA